MFISVCGVLKEYDFLLIVLICLNKESNFKVKGEKVLNFILNYVVK